MTTSNLRQFIGDNLADPWFCERLLDHAVDIVFFIKDLESRYVIVNQTLVSRCRASNKNTLLGKTALEVYPRHLGQFFYAQDKQVLESGREITGRLELHLYHGGSFGWCLTDKIPLFDRDQKVIGLAGISRDIHNPGEEHDEFLQVAQAMEYLQQHFCEPLRIRDLAQQVGLSISRFERLVFRIYGLNPNQLLIQTRISAASQLLTTTDKSITEIAHDCGYADHSAFSRQFRAASGMTPSQFRTTHRGRSL